MEDSLANFVADKSPDFLQQLLGSLQPLAQQDTAYRNNQHMNKVFAANPAFGQALYGAQNDQRTLGLQEEEIMRKRKQQEALKALAGQLQGQPLDRQKALTQYGMITGDLEPLLGVGSGSLPAPIQIANEIARRRAAGDIEGAKLLEQSAKLGEKGTYTDPLTGEVRVIPGYAPSVATIEGAKADAGNISDMTYDPVTAGKTEQAKLGQQLQMEPQIQKATKIAELEAVAASEVVKKAKGSQNTLDILAKAEGLLPYATGSGAGAGVAALKSFAGVSDEKSKADTELELLSGWLTSNVPRMEGPQSDFDVQNYKKMAADLGNKSKPIGDRIAALKSLRELHQKYASLNQETQAAPMETPRQRLERLRAERGGGAP